MIKYVLLIFSLLLISCTPYKCFYKETYNTGQNTAKKKVYRFVLDGSNSTGKTQLKTLNKLESLKIVNVQPEVINTKLDQLPNPEKLKVLILDSLNLKLLPSSLRRFKNLKHLSLNNNTQLNLDKVFKGIEGLSIEFLNLQNNQLTQLPKSITNLKSVKDLNLSNNTISRSTTFDLLAELPRLNSLWLTNNKLKSLPASIGRLSQLKNLYIENNLLTTIPDEMKDMKKVWVVHVGHNSFEELPTTLALMPSLILLHANNCGIKKIPEIYDTKKSHVLGLILDNNELTDTDKRRWKKSLSHYFLLSL